MGDNRNNKSGRKSAQDFSAELLAHTAIIWWLPLLYLLISSLFYLRTYDSAQVKITVMQMGGLALLTLWGARLFEAGKAAFNKEDLICLSPFLAYLAVGILSFIHAPYRMASVDFFLRHFFFMTVALIAIYELNQAATDWLTRVLIWTAWIAVGYGFLQYIDIKWFPPGIGKGLDPFIWRGAFGQRVFSTYGNPNFFGDFLVIVFPIILTQFLKTRRFSLIPLMGMLLIDLVGTMTKGAWLGMGIVLFLMMVISLTYFKEFVASYRKPMLAVLGAGMLTLFGLIAYRVTEGNITSINFRLFTWEATWEMIMTQPLIGTGVGSFPPIYPAFRRPPIFHIEGKHNTETDHSEDEYLEQIFDNGLIGFGIFLWLIISTLVVGFRSLTQLTGNLKDGRPPPRAFDITGYLIAFMGMLGHNFTDVSMRFVSSGVYLGLLSGMIVNLSRGKGLYELHGLREAQPTPSAMPIGASLAKTISEFVIWPARLAAWVGLVYVCGLILKEYSNLPGPALAQLTIGGEVLQWWLAWGVMGGSVLGLGLIFARLVYLSEKPMVALIIFAALYPLYMFWGYFKADVNHNMAIFFSKERRWDKALEHYFKVHELNPDFVMSLYFMGNVYNDRFNMQKVYNQAWGDKNSVARDDYERALDSYNEVRKLSPNYVQMHHQVGNLHMKRAEWAANNGHPEEVQTYLDRALNRFRLYQAIDPVFAQNYYRMGQIYMIRKDYAMAAKTYEDLIYAPKCQAEPFLLSKAVFRNKLLAYQEYEDVPGESLPAHRHESAEAYTNLANSYFMLERYADSEKAYQRALILDPNFDQAKKNIAVLYQKVQALAKKR
ncbi:MAG: hypothetical protein A3J74_02845 [Elusimicrobia bacterium RIFCSPHIGHO2_02_FULL_57_9]|nr:MAG: hypothetical protein A3J74_02845 [Elusimicrobia bacterium RIFCSPHIGHO2_02_FULL_57_9]